MFVLIIATSLTQKVLHNLDLSSLPWRQQQLLVVPLRSRSIAKSCRDPTFSGLLICDSVRFTRDLIVKKEEERESLSIRERFSCQRVKREKAALVFPFWLTQYWLINWIRYTHCVRLVESVSTSSNSVWHVISRELRALMDFFLFSGSPVSEGQSRPPFVRASSCVGGPLSSFFDSIRSSSSSSCE
jgi:hypothetical protein